MPLNTNDHAGGGDISRVEDVINTGPHHQII